MLSLRLWPRGCVLSNKRTTGISLSPEDIAAFAVMQRRVDHLHTLLLKHAQAGARQLSEDLRNPLVNLGEAATQAAEIAETIRVLAEV